MKSILVIISFATFLSTALGAPLCKKNDLKDCAEVLKKVQDNEKEFIKTFNDVCAENPGLKCIKKIVRGDLKEELEYTKQDRPKAMLFDVKGEDESFIFIVEKK